MTKSPNGVRVQIYDQEYFMRGDLDADYIKRLAEFVDARMRSIAERTHTVDSLRVAILAALNIADEYHQTKGRSEAAFRQLDLKVEECDAVVDRLLEQAD